MTKAIEGRKGCLGFEFQRGHCPSWQEIRGDRTKRLACPHCTSSPEETESRSLGQVTQLQSQSPVTLHQGRLKFSLHPVAEASEFRYPRAHGGHFSSRPQQKDWPQTYKMHQMGSLVQAVGLCTKINESKVSLKHIA